MELVKAIGHSEFTLGMTKESIYLDNIFCYLGSIMN